MEIQQHDGVVVEVPGSRQGFAKRKRGGRGVTGGREAPGLGVLLPCASPLYIGVEGAGFLSSMSIGALAKVGERNPIISLPHRLLSPFLGILILSLWDMNLFLLRGILVRLDQGCGALPPLPTFMWVPPCRWAPLRNLLEPSRYNTEKSRTFSGGQNRTSHI